MEEDTVLEGGMMNSPVKKGDVVIRPCTAFLQNTHRGIIYYCIPAMNY